jgi:hypothetical protein
MFIWLRGIEVLVSPIARMAGVRDGEQVPGRSGYTNRPLPRDEQVFALPRLRSAAGALRTGTAQPDDAAQLLAVRAYAQSARREVPSSMSVTCQSAPAPHDGPAPVDGHSE